MFKALFWITDKLFQMMIFSYFIRIILEISQFILISSIYEIKMNNTTDFYRSVSFSFSILVLVFYAIIIIIILYRTFSSYELIEGNHNMFEEFFRGLKADKKHKLYSTILFLRRATFVILLITLTSVSSRILIALLSTIQVVYVIFLSRVRPYAEVKGNLIEILNEIYYGGLLTTLSLLNTKSDWTSLKTNFYMWTLVSNTFVVFVIVVAFPTIYIGKLVWRR